MNISKLHIQPTSNEPDFKVSLDDIWQDWGYSRKNKAVDYLRRNYNEGIDFCCTNGEANSGSGGHNIIEYLLTENCALEMARNIQTQSAKEFKIRKLDESASLIDELNKLSGPDLITLGLQKLQIENQNLIGNITEMKPKVDAYNQLMDSDGLFSVSQVSRILGIGRNNLFNILRNIGIFDGTVPKSHYMNSKHFKIKAKYATNSSTDRPNCYPQTFLTPKGLDFIRKQLIKNRILDDENNDSG